MIPALVVDPRRHAKLAKNPRRAAYYCDAVASLSHDLAARGGALVCRHGEAVSTAVRLAREARAERVVWSARYDARAQGDSRALQSALEEAGLTVSIVHDAPAVAPEDTAAARPSDGGRGYRSFAPYYSTWSAQPREPISTTPAFADPALPSDALPVAAHDRSGESNARASESAVRAAFERYLGGGIFSYASARNVPAGEPTSRLSAALSFGLISARTVLARTDDLARDPFLLTEEKFALATFTRALALRDFFLQLAWFFEETPDQLLQTRMSAFPTVKKHAALGAWIEGRTGYPLVDAGIRQLRATGWMHPRVRSIAASFLCFDLGVDWRVGRDAWDLELIEDEPALANGNWQWIAGVCADLAQVPRIYNPRKQARTFDASGAYVRRWIPEIVNVSGADIFDIGAAERRRQLALPLYGGDAYPLPVLEHEASARAFLTRYAEFAKTL